MRRVAVTGAGVVSALGVGLPPFWTALRTGTPGIGPIRAVDCSTLKFSNGAEVPDFDPLRYFDEKTAGVSKAEVYLMLGRMHVLANEIPKARNMFERGLEVDPTNVDLKAALAGLG